MSAHPLRNLLAALPLLLPCGLLHAAAPPEPAGPTPSPQQLAWQRMEMTMFLHFGVNTFSDREWGEGAEDPKIFSPSALDARQWVRAAKDAGFKLVILTAKHHDGFCLWPSKHTRHSVQASPWKNGKGDVVREFIDACRAGGVGSGIYLSPWDRNHPQYGDSPQYNRHFVAQLDEISDNYGPIDEFWFDGACGEGPNGRKQEYDWKAYYQTIYGHNPKAVIAICGPDIRWVGNESGVARPGESSVKDAGTGDRPDANGKVWYPAECDVSIRPGWFYHKSEDDKVKSLDHLLDIYFKSVGRNSVLLLNVPPDQRGLIADPDLARLREFRAALDEIFATDFAAGRPATASNTRAGFPPAQAVDGNLDSYWATDDDTTGCWLEIDLGEPRRVNLVSVQEFIPLGEKVGQYRIEVMDGGGWRKVAGGTVIGQKNLVQFPEVTTDRLRLVIEQAMACPAIAGFGAFFNPRWKDHGSGSLAAHRPATASNVHGEGTVYGGDKAIDDDPATRWATSDEIRECWLEVDLGESRPLGSLMITEFESRITRFQLETRDHDGAGWKAAFTGTKAGKQFKADFAPVTARHVRLHILDATFAPTIWEFQVFPPAK